MRRLLSVLFVFAALAYCESPAQAQYPRPHGYFLSYRSGREYLLYSSSQAQFDGYGYYLSKVYIAPIRRPSPPPLPPSCPPGGCYPGGIYPGGGYPGGGYPGGATMNGGNNGGNRGGSNNGGNRGGSR